MRKTPIMGGTVARTICLFLALLNQVMTVTGHTVLPIDDEMITQFVSLTATIITAIMAWWKNNSFTYAARVADQTMYQLKRKEQDGTG